MATATANAMKRNRTRPDAPRTNLPSLVLNNHSRVLRLASVDAKAVGFKSVSAELVLVTGEREELFEGFTLLLCFKVDVAMLERVSTGVDVAYEAFS